MLSSRATRLRRIGCVAMALALAACSTVRTGFVKQPSSAIAPVSDTPTARYVSTRIAAHPGQSGFRLLTKNTQALMARLASIDRAESSVDMQYYIFHNDDTGRLIAQRLVAAADRGVRVRLLLDDISSNDADAVFAALDAHPNIEVRFFNPFKSRSKIMFARAFQILIEPNRLNRRMHNKALIVDNRVAVVGGRNIGDEYFDAANDSNFRDLDVMTIGPVVPAFSASFDIFWNSEAAYPVSAFKDLHASAADLAKLSDALKQHARAFAQSDYAQALLEDAAGTAPDARGPWCWGDAKVIADTPDKLEPDRRHRRFTLASQFRTLVDGAQSSVILVSPYFIPGDSGVSYLTALSKRGVPVKVLTNSLAASDEPAVHAHYQAYRRPLLNGGVELYELKPEAGAEQPATAGGKSSGQVSLHAKTAVIDGKRVFIGSMNMDPRSRVLNTENGVFVECEDLAGQITAYFNGATAPENAFQAKVENGHIVLVDRERGEWVTHPEEAGATTTRRFESVLFRLLPIEGLL